MLSGYIQQSLAHAEELATALSETEIDAIREWFAKHGVSLWRRHFHVDNSNMIRAYVQATPSQRKRSKALNKYHPLIVLGAYQHCVKAAAMLGAANHLQRGPSYRAMTAEAGALFDSMQEFPPDDDFPWDWPWEWGDPNPFDPNEDD